MATLVRSSEHLLAVRCTVEMSQSGALLAAEPFRGEEALAEPLRVPLTDLGFPATARERQNGFRPKVPDALKAMFEWLGDQAGGPEALWVQLAYGAETLGAYPWEEVFSDTCGRAILRVPNFVRPGYTPASDRPIAICGATPRAKGIEDWGDALLDLLDSLPVFENRDIVLFHGDDMVPDPVRDLDRLGESYPHFRFLRAALPVAAEAPARARTIPQSSEVSNPWLTWMAAALGPEGAHAVHFLCPGYASNTHGALALPESPLFDRDAQWSRFVGAQELARFCDTIGAQLVTLTALGGPQWSTGLRLLLNELSWRRPGPVLLNLRQRDHQLAAAFHALAGEPFYPDPAPGLVFSVHPKAISAAEPVAAFRTITRGVRTATFAPSAQPSGNTRGTGHPAPFGMPEDLSPASPETQTSGSGLTLPADLQRTLDQIGSARPKSRTQEARDQGALRALEFVSKLTGGDFGGGTGR
ncbi:hypothetical protein [Sagittula sp.]|uniref:hypothetical protein n=1 Tax=Sagittula sp. TaxID=2038081 RepID=UPI003512BFDE